MLYHAEYKGRFHSAGHVDVPLHRRVALVPHQLSQLLSTQPFDVLGRERPPQASRRSARTPARLITGFLSQRPKAFDRIALRTVVTASPHTP
jgi:hypothetical protein